MNVLFWIFQIQGNIWFVCSLVSYTKFQTLEILVPVIKEPIIIFLNLLRVCPSSATTQVVGNLRAVLIPVNHMCLQTWLLFQAKFTLYEMPVLYSSLVVQIHCADIPCFVSRLSLHWNYLHLLDIESIISFSSFSLSIDFNR